MRYPGFLRTFGSRLGAGLADELLDRWFPQPPTFLERLRESLVEAMPQILDILSRITPTATPPTQDDVMRAVAASTIPAEPGAPPPFKYTPGKKLGEIVAEMDAAMADLSGVPASAARPEFTCPKCGGHTWNTMGPAYPPVVERYCTNGLETAYGPDLNPNTVKEPCMFRWKSTEDHLYFAKPSAEDVRRYQEPVTCAPPSRPKVRWSGDPTCASLGGCKAEDVRRSTETSACMPPSVAKPITGSATHSIHFDSAGVVGTQRKARDLADWDRGVDWGRPVLGVTGNAVEEVYDSLVKAIGNRFTDAEESLGRAAARIITEADAFIDKQSKQIADLMLDNVFPAGKGEVGFLLTHDIAKKIGVRYEEGAHPFRVALVLDGWRWAVRLGPARVGGELIKVDWDVAEAIMREAKTAWMCGNDHTSMAQNAAGGVA